MKIEEEASQNDIKISQKITFNKISYLNKGNNFNYLHYIINFIINLSLTVSAFIEFIFQKYNTIFNFIVDFFILLVFSFVISYFITQKINHLKGFVFYPFCSFFWGIADLLSLNYSIDSYKWNIYDNLKIIKLSLIAFSIIINNKYYKVLNQ